MKKICKISGREFEITDDDLAFYEKMGVPAPTLCPEERERRRFAHRNERTLYRRKCDCCGKNIISIYDTDSIVPTYCADCWWGDGWSGKSYARDFDFTRPFFEQFLELQKNVPHLALWNHASENSDYNNCSFNNRNCYMNFTTDKSEDCYYNTSSDSCQDVMDSYEARNCELCYECLDCINCYNTKYLQNCKNCRDSSFLKNCIGCSDCFGCMNLRNKQYWFFNEECTKEEYERKISRMRMGSSSQINDMRKNFEELVKKLPHKYAEIENCENSTGNYIRNSKNAQNCFDTQNAFDVKYCTYVTYEPLENTMDSYAVGGSKNCYETMAGPGASDSSFIFGINRGPNKSLYCVSCINNCQDLLGCVGLTQSQYCILNKQYSKEEYESLKERIIAHMKQTHSTSSGSSTGEFGEFFPAEISLFGYNETIAQDFYPLEKEEALSRGYKWKEVDKKDYRLQNYVIPDSIKEVEDDILQAILACEVTGRNYKIQKGELEFYRKMDISIPRICPDERNKRRLILRNPRKLWARKCDKCEQEILSTFAPERLEKVYCERCYLDCVN